MNFAERLLIEIFNLSLSASLVAVIVFALRLLLKKTPKIYSYILWLIVFVRFLCPFTIQSAISLVPIKNKTITYTDPFTERITINSGIRSLDIVAHNAINSNAVLPVLKKNINFLELLLAVMSVIWLIGMLTILLIALLRYMQLKKKLRTATRLNIGICGGCEVFETDQMDSPFLMGIIKPKIYVPLGMREQDLSYVLMHELIHRKRKDYIAKPFCFLAVVLHWFNPMVWVSFHMLVKDMEMSCDEAVIKKNKEDIRTKYSTALLQISMKQSGLFLPIAFGESSTKDRIKNILNFKKPAAWLGVWGVIILAAISIMFLTSEKAAHSNISNSNISKVKLSSEEMNLLELLVKNRNPYVGDHIKDIALINILPVPEGLKYDHIELQTDKAPYCLTVVYQLAEGIKEYSTTGTEISNAVLLFATIENMDICRFLINQSNDSIIAEYNRADSEKALGKLYSQSANEASMTTLMKQMKDYIIHIPYLVTKGAEDLESSITRAIMDFNQLDYTNYIFKTEDHIILDTVKKDNSVTVYAMVLYQEYGYEDGEIKDIAGNHVPVAITFDIGKNGEYMLKEYWIPKDGSYYIPSIKEKFPAELVKEAIDTQQYIRQQQEACDQKLQEYLQRLKKEADEKREEFRNLLEKTLSK